MMNDLFKSALPRLLFPAGSDQFDVRTLDFERIKAEGRQDSSAAYLFRAEEADGCAAAVIRYAPGGAAPPHRHHGYELIYVLDGEMKTTHGVVRTNDLVLLPPGSVHASSTDTGCLALIVWQRPVEKME
ncbi:cupin domain-containing protein [Rhizobium sp.]|jgi:anti-sigma factor ChrR (cupin superfamily)|uniref:cupin domain-containing protein n=1 Tax=Rhizobium sp. TaxID=391 RepID=UPI000E8A801E|nr:allophanate hydrolase [Rhizobium sp.]